MRDLPFYERRGEKRMESSREKLDNYQKNLRCMQEVADKLLGHMKGHDYSFQPEITDKKGNFSQEKLCGLLEEMLSIWEENLRWGSAMDPSTGKSVAEPYLQARRELCRLYLYLVMRCSLYPGGYSDARDGAEKKERTDFAFLLEQAKQLSQDWCVITGRDGKRRSVPYSGFDGHFGFHLYRALQDPDGAYGSNGNDWSLTPDWKQACGQPAYLLTDEGNTKRISIKRFSGMRRRAEPPAEEEEPAPPDEAVCDAADGCDDGPAEVYDAEDGDLAEVYDDYDRTEEDDFWSFWGVDDEFRLAEMERLSEKDSREQGLMLLCAGFQCADEYLSACSDFAKLFEQAAPEVLRGFYADLEQIVNLYLVSREIPPLLNTDQTLDVYSRAYDGACRQARRYARGTQWKTL